MLASSTGWQRFLVLAPAFVIGVGLILGLLIVLGRGLVENVRDSGHQRLLVGCLVGLVGVIAILTYLGIELPRE
jgi:hypothetical protein